MKLLLVPHAATGRQAEVWIGVFGRASRPPTTQLVGDATQPVPEAGWQPVDLDGMLPREQWTVWIQTVTVRGLEPGRRYRLTCDLDGERASCTTGTLPEALPRQPAPAFTVLLGSCFAWFQDRAGLVGANVARLPEAFKPDVKLLCGDQVYLDNPWWEVLPREQAGLAERLLGKYVGTWTNGGGSSGFSRLLAEGATYFLADDHEFWNNHPNWSPLLGTRNVQERREWEEVARQLYATFQATPGRPVPLAQRFAVDPVEFYLIDTRLGRQAGDEQFMDPTELARLVRWLRDDPGDSVGILVLSAPLFTQPAGWLSSKFADRSLANYRQYVELADAVLASRRSLLVLAGDVHFGRVATANLASRASLVELVASPLALVDAKVGGKFKPAPDQFPVRAGQSPRVPVTTGQWEGWTGLTGEGLANDHFSTLGFTATEQAVHVAVTAWQIAKASPHQPERAGTRTFTLARRPA